MAPPLRILISGAGFAGPAVAFWLARLGHKCTIVERFPGLRANGQQIDLREQGIDAAVRMGILDEVRRRAVDEEGLELVDARGKVQLRIKKSEPGQRQNFTSEFEIMRGDMCNILFEATEKRVTYKFGLSVDSFDNADDGVTVTLSDGTVETYDLLVGADGQGSRIRKKMLAESGLEDSYRTLGAFCCHYTIPRRADDSRNMAMACQLPGRRFYGTRWHSKERGQVYWMTMAQPDALREALKHDSRSQKDAFASIFHDAGWQAPRLLKDMDEADDFYAQEILQVKTKCWSRGRVVLLGDAGYTPSPFTGMGTSLALIGAYVLAGEIAKHPDDMSAALEGYDRTLRPLVDQVQQLPPGFPGLLFAKSALGVRLLHLVLRLLVPLLTILRPVTDALFSKGKSGWKLPKYPELGEVKAMNG